MKAKAVPSKSSPRPHHRTTMGIEQRARTKGKIIDASIKVFAEKGPYAPVIEDFVKAAGIGRGTFYYYFSTVEEVRRLAIETITQRHSVEVMPVIALFTNPIFRFSMALRLYQRRAMLDPMFAAFMSSTTYTSSDIKTLARRDVQLAIDRKLVKIRNVDAAFTIFVALNQYAARYPKRRRPAHLQGSEVARMILLAWGAEVALIEEALSIPLPPVKTLHLF